MRFLKFLALVLAVLCLSACGQNAAEPNEGMQRKIQRRCAEIQSQYRQLYEDADKQMPDSRWEEPVLSHNSLDAIEALLQQAGLNVLRSGEKGPEYLTTGEQFRTFLDAVRQNRQAGQEVISIRPSGDLGYRLFTYEDGQMSVYSMVASITGEADPVYEVHPVLDWELTDRGNFYYSIYPQWDKHYVAYTLIRLEVPDEALWELNRKYISAGGYVGSNLFLTDWTEGSLKGLCFNDLWEYLYRYEHGEQFSPAGYDYSQESHCYEIPAEEFEGTILPYFDMDRAALRSLAGYDPERNTYPWRQIQSNELVSILGYYTMEPEVISSRVNPDGTLTMTVQVLSTDLKTDCLFSHEVTVRPLGEAGFQFVSNRVLSQGAQGLPYCQPRFTWPVPG